MSKQGSVRTLMTSSMSAVEAAFSARHRHLKDVVGEVRRCYCETRLGIVSCSIGSKWTESVGTEWERFVLHSKREERKGGQRREGV